MLFDGVIYVCVVIVVVVESCVFDYGCCVVLCVVVVMCVVWCVVGVGVCGVCDGVISVSLL